MLCDDLEVWDEGLRGSRGKCVHVKSLQSCPALCNPMDYSPSGSSVHREERCLSSRQEHWSGLPFPPPGDLPNSRMEPASLMSPALAGGFFTTGTTYYALRRKGIYVYI